MKNGSCSWPSSIANEITLTLGQSDAGWNWGYHMDIPTIIGALAVKRFDANFSVLGSDHDHHSSVFCPHFWETTIDGSRPCWRRDRMWTSRTRVPNCGFKTAEFASYLEKSSWDMTLRKHHCSPVCLIVSKPADLRRWFQQNSCQQRGWTDAVTINNPLIMKIKDLNLHLAPPGI